MGGVFLTRGIVFIPIIFYFSYLLRINDWRFTLTLLVSAFLTVICLLLPFYIWNPTVFLSQNPFTKQASLLPFHVLLLIVLISIFVGWRYTHSLNNVIRYSGYALFGIVTLAFALKIHDAGFYLTVFDHGFDLSYFQFCVPFLLLIQQQSENDPEGNG